MSVLFQVLASDASPGRQVPASLRGARPQPVAPRLDPNERARLVKARAAENQLLASYQWLDPEHETARIPVTRAMEILVQQGLTNSK
jgi:hypothetical protein